ncbi:hypothetical protein [Massilimicrobiota sp. SW1139]|uniref:hypothetical protein n=1 Tax=Massilimicrobiota sp. SW1139 TaxID=2530043 RepID=UPI001439EAD1|nr:hypothetical protein [Massilimicrobiota sp. SW1139]NJE44960.1 hypothetical protein [Massilimicrobiota sp. SW1139]
MFFRLHVIISSENEKDEKLIKDLLYQIRPTLSISPAREYAGLKDHSEFYATDDITPDQVQPLLDQLNNDWDGTQDDCICYGFNTKMFHELIYYLGFTLFE